MFLCCHLFQVVREAYPDHTQFDQKSEYYDAAAKPDSPKWFMVDVKLVRKLSRLIPLEELKQAAASGGPLASMALVKFGRLSVQHVTATEWEAVLAMEAAGSSQEEG
jgi:predicted RNA-binding protein with PUA-like domain